MTAGAARAFESARAPQRWRNRVAAAAARPRELRMRTAWVGRFAACAPRLCESPLFGAALADLVAQLGGGRARAAERAAPRRTSDTGAPPHASARAAQQTSPAKPPPAPSSAPAARARTQRGAAANATPARSGTASDTIAALPRVLDGLARTAPESLLASVLRRAAPDNPAHASRRGSAPAAPRATHGPTGAPFARSVAFAGAPTSAPRMAGSPPAVTSSLRARILGRTNGVATAPRSGAAIEQDWSRSPLGPRAPASLLQRIVASPSAAASARRNSRAPAVPHEGTRPDDSPHATPDANREPRRGEIAAPQSPRSAPAHATAPFGPERAAESSPPGAPFAAPARSAPGRPFAPAAQPSHAPPFALPESSAPAPATPFAWPRSFAEPALTVAAGAAGGHAPFARADEHELDLLSAQLEHILTEQARRHGIDV